MTIKSSQQKRSYGTAIPVQKNPYHQASQQPLSNQGGMMQTLKESIVGGFGAGIGMNIADRTISSIFGARKVEVQHTGSDTNVVSDSTENTECQNIIKSYKESLSNGISQTLQEKYEKCKSTW
jgi:hypothetical protein